MQTIKQRDLTRVMKAAKAAGITSFDLIDSASGLIFRATTETSLTPAQGDLDAELRDFEARQYG